MSEFSKTLELLTRHLRMAAPEAELLARAREALAKSEALLQQSVPSTFIGKQKSLPAKE
ncbi:hypothetical protein [Bradyrhizobium sp. CB1015]|uniref:hypothetical protein n=1 Tax=Bradyrhizobium sp. CB1015 TaxID=2976822 RepID=UPI0021AA9456|nr:hypothetical protein [Bradyrhizobium sp. CB1015]UWU89379.1 hypothetical protein N2604_23040 [Bradyrhizobium sp. CB1015]